MERQTCVIRKTRIKQTKRKPKGIKTLSSIHSRSAPLFQGGAFLLRIQVIRKVGSSFFGSEEGLFMTPVLYSFMIPTHQYIRHFPATKILGSCINRRC